MAYSFKHIIGLYLVISHLQGHLDEGIWTDLAFLHDPLAILVMDQHMQVQVSYVLFGKLLGRVDAGHTCWGELPLESGRHRQGLAQVIVPFTMAIWLIAQVMLHITGVFHNIGHNRCICPRVLSIDTQLQHNTTHGQSARQCKAVCNQLPSHCHTPPR